MHGSGPMRFASPSSYRTLTDYSSPVSERTEIRTPDPQIRNLVLAEQETKHITLRIKFGLAFAV
jgi:hypothetical protein